MIELAATPPLPANEEGEEAPKDRFEKGKKENRPRSPPPIAPQKSRFESSVRKETTQFSNELNSAVSQLQEKLVI